MDQRFSSKLNFTKEFPRAGLAYLHVPELGKRFDDDAKDDVESDSGEEDEECDLVDGEVDELLKCLVQLMITQHLSQTGVENDSNLQGHCACGNAKKIQTNIVTHCSSVRYL